MKTTGESRWPWAARWSSTLRRLGIRRDGAAAPDAPADVGTRLNGVGLTPSGPKKHLEDDRLNRTPFAENIAAMIRTYSSPDSLVVGIYGPWGSGKSTVLNFVAGVLDGDRGLEVGRFNPWNFSDQDRLTSSFFRFLSSLLKRTLASEEMKSAAQTLDALAAFASPASLFGAGFLSDTLKQYAKTYRGEADRLADIERVKDEISNAITLSGKRYVIIMDDIDRLTTSEIRQVSQLVKAMADFDRVTYVLAFERERVARALDGVANGRGDAFLEKIVNIQRTLPPLTTRQVQQLVVAELDAYSDRHPSYDWDIRSNTRLGDILRSAMDWFTTMRQIERLSNALVSVEDLVSGEVDYADHLGLTLVQTLEPAFHEFMSSHASLFVDDLKNQFVSDREKRDASDKRDIDEQLERLTVLSPEGMVALLSPIFPKIRGLYGSGGLAKRHWGDPQWEKSNRACADFTTYSRYFILGIDEGDLSNAEFSDIKASLSDLKTFENKVLAIKDTQRLERLMQRIGSLGPDEISNHEILVLITALLDIVDLLPPDQGFADFLFGFRNKAIATTANMLGRLPKTDRLEVVLAALRLPARSVDMVTTFIQRAKPSKKSQDQSDLFMEDDVPVLNEALSRLLQDRFRANAFADQASAPFLLYQWSRISPEIFRSTVRARLEADDAAFVAVLGTLTHVTLSASPKPVPLDLNLLSRLYTTDELVHRLDAIATSGDNAMKLESRRLLDLLREAIPLFADPRKWLTEED